MTRHEQSKTHLHNLNDPDRPKLTYKQQHEQKQKQKQKQEKEKSTAKNTTTNPLPNLIQTPRTPEHFWPFYPYNHPHKKHQQ